MDLSTNLLKTIQAEIISILFTEGLLNPSDCGCQNESWNDNKQKFCGFVLKKFSSEGDIGFSVVKLNTEEYCRCENCMKDQHKDEKYVSETKLNSSKTVIYATLNKKMILQKVMHQILQGQSVPMDHFLRNQGVSKRNNKTIYVDAIVIHIKGDINTVWNTRILMVACALKQFLLQSTRVMPAIYYIQDYSKIYCFKEMDLYHILEGLNIATCDFISDKHQFDSNIVIDKLKQSCYKVEDDTTNCVVLDGRKFICNSNNLQDIYLKEIDQIEVVDETGEPTRALSTALNIHKVHKDQDDGYNLLHVISSKEFYKVQQSTLLLQMFNEDLVIQNFIKCIECKQPLSELTLISEWLNLRKDELWKSYKMKYGKNITGVEWEEVVGSVAVASLKLDILSTPVSKAMKLLHSDESDDISSRNSIFILYNYARLCTISKHHDEKVQQGLYPTTPSPEDVDFTLLSEQGEWNIIIRYLMVYPILIEEMIFGMVNHKRNAQLPVSHLCLFLLNLSQDWSSYYHQTKILLDGRPHLFPLMFARYYFAMTVKKVMKHCFDILGIKPPESM